MIVSFGDRATEGLYHNRPTSRAHRFPQDVVGLALVKLDMLNGSAVILDLRSPPGNRVEALKGDLNGFSRSGSTTNGGLSSYLTVSHKGYEQLAIILEKQGNFQEAIDLSTLAFRQGWSGDWDGRIERCRKKAEKA